MKRLLEFLFLKRQPKPEPPIVVYRAIVWITLAAVRVPANMPPWANYHTFMMERHDDAMALLPALENAQRRGG